MTMFVKQYGQGSRVFFGLHGWSGDHATFAPLVPFLPTDATLYSVDLPGHGKSPSPAKWELAALGQDIAAEILRLPTDSVTLIGNCSGALLGLSALQEVPALLKRVSRLVMLDPFAYTPWYFSLFVSPAWGPIGRYAYLSTFANPLGRWLTNLSLKGHRTEDTDLTHSFRRIDHEVSYRYLQLLTSIGGIETWRRIQLPTDIVYGAHSFGAIKTSVGMWQTLWPHARAHELAGAGHLPIKEATEALSKILFNPT